MKLAVGHQKTVNQILDKLALSAMCRVNDSRKAHAHAQVVTVYSFCKTIHY